MDSEPLRVNNQKEEQGRSIILLVDPSPPQEKKYSISLSMSSNAMLNYMSHEKFNLMPYSTKVGLSVDSVLLR